MKKYIVLFIISVGLPIGIVKANILCNDGTTSPSCTTCHRGCCSKHGGCASTSSYSKKSNGNKSKTNTNSSVDYNNKVITDSSSKKTVKDDEKDSEGSIAIGIATLIIIASVVYNKKK